MFKFLKDKIKEAVNRFSKDVEEPKEEPANQEVIKEKEPEKKQEIIHDKPLEKANEFKKHEIAKEEPKIEDENPAKAESKEPGFFKKLTQKVTSKKIDEGKFESLFYDLELILLENNVALDVVDRIKESMKMDLVDVDIKGSVADRIKESLRESVNEILSFKQLNIIDKIKEKKPFIILFVGINGSGKTTTIAKFANLLKKNKLKCVIAASDTFRAASIEQLEYHAEKLGIKLVKHKYGSDPAAVAFYSIKHAEAHNLDVVLIDTAGRMHSNENLIDEMKKIVRVAKPDLKIFVGESITGNDCLEQAKTFNNAINLDGIILSKADVDEKGGTALSISYVTKKPVLYMGTGQSYDNLEEFSKEKVVKSLGL